MRWPLGIVRALRRRFFIPEDQLHRPARGVASAVLRLREVGITGIARVQGVVGQPLQFQWRVIQGRAKPATPVDAMHSALRDDSSTVTCVRR